MLAKIFANPRRRNPGPRPSRLVTLAWMSTVCPGLNNRLGKLDLVDGDLIDTGRLKSGPFLSTSTTSPTSDFSTSLGRLAGITRYERQERLDRGMVLETPTRRFRRHFR